MPFQASETGGEDEEPRGDLICVWTKPHLAATILCLDKTAPGSHQFKQNHTGSHVEDESLWQQLGQRGGRRRRQRKRRQDGWPVRGAVGRREWGRQAGMREQSVRALRFGAWGQEGHEATGIKRAARGRGWGGRGAGCVRRAAGPGDAVSTGREGKAGTGLQVGGRRAGRGRGWGEHSRGSGGQGSNGACGPEQAKKQGRKLLEKVCPASCVRCYQDPPPELMTRGIFKTQEKSRLQKVFPV